MTIFKKIIAIVAGTAAISAMAIGASAATSTATVSCYKSDDQHYKSGDVELKTFYDFGTPVPFDNARIYAKSSSTESKYVFAFIKYSNFDTDNFMTKRETSDKGGTAYVNYNPFDADMLEPGSYANAYCNGQDFYLRVTY